MLRRFVFTSVSLLALATCAPALADSLTDNYTSSIVVPSSNPSFLVDNEDAGSQLTISGNIQDTTTNTPPDHATASCVSGIGTNSEYMVGNYHAATVGSNWGTTVPMTSLGDGVCQLVLLPMIGSSSYGGWLPALNLNVAGPWLYVASQTRRTISGGPNDGAIDDFFVGAPQANGWGEYESAGACGLDTASAFSSAGHASASALFYCNDYFEYYNGNDRNSGTRSGLLVDGNHAYLPEAAYDLTSYFNLTTTGGIPNVSYSVSWDQSVGAPVITESEPVVECSPQPNVYPPTPSSCSSFVGAGVTLNRTIAQSASTVAYATFADTWTSTDGSGHTLDMLSKQQFNRVRLV